MGLLPRARFVALFFINFAFMVYGLSSESKPGLYVTVTIHVLLKKAIIFSRVMRLLKVLYCLIEVVLHFTSSLHPFLSLLKGGNYFEKPGIAD